jgi:hypothetical protein
MQRSGRRDPNIGAGGDRPGRCLNAASAPISSTALPQRPTGSLVRNSLLASDA